MNYFPARQPWAAMWTHYNHAIISSDLKAIASLGANTVRVIVAPYAVGWPDVRPRAAADLRDFVRTAARDGIRVMLTLFDGWGTYWQGAESERWIRSLLKPYKTDPRIVLLELQNELPFSRPFAMSWAEKMMGFLHRLAPKIPRTISLSGCATASDIRVVNTLLLAHHMNVVDVHLYSTFAQDYKQLRAAKLVAAGRPTIVGEAGVSTGSVTTRATQEAQANFFVQLERLCNRVGIPNFAPWTLNDLNGGRGVTQYFGLRELDGHWKLAAAVVRHMFEDEAPGNSTSSGGTNLLGDPHFSDASASPNSAGSLGAWRVISGSNTHSTGTIRTPNRQGRVGFLSGAFADSTGWPALAQQCVVGRGGVLRLQSSVRLLSATGTTTISLAFYNEDGGLIRIDNATAAQDTIDSWQRLSVTSQVPPSAIVVVVALKTVQNVGTALFENARLSERR